MKRFTIIMIILLSGNYLFGQMTKIDTSFFSQALGEEKMVDVLLPPGYFTNSNIYYPVIYYLHGWGGDQNTVNEMISITGGLISSGTIDEVIIVGADNSPEPFNGSMYVNSVTWGNYEDYMVNDLVTWVETSFRTVPQKKYRALIGQSMGAYGAFRYGILHKEKFRALVAHAGVLTFDKDIYINTSRQNVLQESQPGPPYTYSFSTGGFTAGTFLFCGAFSPNPNSTQYYINPQIVDFPYDENGDYIDSVYAKFQQNDILGNFIHQLSAEDSVGIFFGCGTADGYLVYPAHLAMKDTLDTLGIPYEYYSHNGGHAWPNGFKENGLVFLDSIMGPPILSLEEEVNCQFEFSVYPNPFENTVTLKFKRPLSKDDGIRIFNLTGNVVKMIQLFSYKSKSEIMLNMEEFPSGIYFISLHSMEGIITKKIIKVAGR
ncbi:MAG: T9SS type A sorting domain-containing protein [Bacteroidales bacterium]|nr:T9SS type A sorting domain-containing protein [Bacteroidales bacterium]MCF8454277.1 T9SS type A sorting domain-containing protein [Bacteroidales bacterium]